jgi:hypothetical protein
MKIKHVDDFLEDPGASDWFKMALRSALERDPVDAANDAEVLVSVLRSQCNMLLNRPAAHCAGHCYVTEYVCHCLPPLDGAIP